MTEMTTPETLRRVASRFASSIATPTSPLYARIAGELAGDDELLAFAASVTPAHQPGPLLLLASVHYLLLRHGGDGELSRWYPSVSGEPTPAGDPYPVFRRFVLDRREEIVAIAAGNRVQTNEVGRTAFLTPAYCAIARAADRPLGIVEVGTSAGLNLLWDRYRYRYERPRREPLESGDRTSPVLIESEVRGPTDPPLDDPLPRVAARVGIDLDPIDLRTDHGRTWAKALLWPDQRDRFRRLDAAVGLAAAHPPPIIAGDATHELQALAASIPSDAALCVAHTFVINQFTPAQRTRFEQLLAVIAERRIVWEVAIEMHTLLITLWQRGDPEPFHEARAHHHGAWIDWAASTPEEA